MEKLVKYQKSELGLKASALTPRLYRIKYGRDMIVDLNKLKKDFEKVGISAETSDDEAIRIQLSVFDLTVFEDITFIMARQYNKAHGLPVPEDIDEWLDSMDEVFTVYEVLPSVLELWALNQMTTSTPAKK